MKLYGALLSPFVRKVCLIAEEKEVSAAHLDLAKELESLLNRYRDGGYSRELPPAGMKPKAALKSANRYSILSYGAA